MRCVEEQFLEIVFKEFMIYQNKLRINGQSISRRNRAFISEQSL